MIYHKAITRKPGQNFSEGITTASLGTPDYAKALRQHARYVSSLKSHGLEVVVLESDLKFPDGCFVEDTAVVTPQMAVITNPGAASRKGETKTIIEVLRPLRKLFFIEPPGTMDGGDVLRAEHQFFVGLSGRTNKEGIKQFEEIVRHFGYTVTAVPLGNILHLKSGVSYVGDNTLIAVTELAKRPEFRTFEKIELKPEENYSANCVRIDARTLFIASGYPGVKKELATRNYTAVELEVGEFQKMDGGLSCLSLLC